MISYYINLITLTRIFLGIAVFFLVMMEDRYILALILFLVASITDYIDGFLARKFNAVSPVGEILDPIADKVLVIFIFFALSVNLSSFLIAFSASIIISREILVSALRDYSSRNNLVYFTRVTFMAKIKTSVQLFTIFIYLLGLSINNMLIIVIADILILISVLITLYTGYNYFDNVIKESSK